MTMRQRNKLTAMRLVQSTFVTKVEQQGFDTTTVEETAKACGTSASTIYRHFETKENIVLWDEYDDVIDDVLAQRLGKIPPVEAFREAVLEAFDQRDDYDLLLRKLKLTFSVEALWAAAARQERTSRRELAVAIAFTQGRPRPSISDLITASTCFMILDVALDQWQTSDGEQHLADLVDAALLSVRNTPSP